MESYRSIGSEERETIHFHIAFDEAIRSLDKIYEMF